MARDAWTVLDGHGPYAELEGADQGCDSRGFRVREDARQATDTNPDGIIAAIDTASCPFVTVTQPTVRALHAGETIEAAVFHFRLQSIETAEAFVSVRVGESVVLEEALPIEVPAPADVCPTDVTEGYCRSSERLVGRWTALHDVAEGTPLYFHVHNHGTNEYWLTDLAPLAP